MNKKYEQINYDQLWSQSGDAFADAGGYALKYISERYPSKDILELIEYVTDIYVDSWDGKIHAFFLNSPITQPANKDGEKKKKATLVYFKLLINEKLHSIEGYCRILGIKTKLFPAGRDNSVLSGSGTFANFHHTFETGMMLSKEAIIRYHFLPLASEMLCGKLCVIHSPSISISELFARNCAEKNFINVGQKSQRVISNPAKSPSTAIFRFLDNVLLTIDDDNSDYLNLYHFTNFGAKPELQIYTLPFEAFNFYRETQKSIYKDNWNKFVSSHYYYHKPNLKHNQGSFNSYDTEYDIETSTLKIVKKNENRIIEENEYKYWNNVIYEKIIKQDSILRCILRWSINNLFDINLVKCYLYNMLRMKKETIDKIMKLADFVVENTKEADMKKTLMTLNGIKNPYLLRRFLLKIVEKNYFAGNAVPIITVKDYTEYLFSDDNMWQEIRDVLLIAIYQKLHENEINVEGIEIEYDSEDDEY